MTWPACVRTDASCMCASLFLCSWSLLFCLFFFFNDTATTEIYTLSLHDALPIYFFPLAKRMGHQKLSTLRSISAPRAYTPVIQSQYRHQIRSCPTSPVNFWRLTRSEEHTSELQSPCNLVCRLLLEKKKKRQLNRH